MRRGAARSRSGCRRDQSFVGFLVERPYPHLRTLDDQGRVRTVLLVSQSKGGYRGDVAPDRLVRIYGHSIERAKSMMLEVTSIEAADDAELDARLRSVAGEARGAATLVGEIVDSKCHFGRMRPGRGRAHRACAQLCIAGGIPPILVCRDGAGKETHYVVCSTAEGPVGDDVLPFVAEPVEVTGDLVRRGDMNLLFVDPARIRRIR